jgi:hypothetical protein
VLGVEKMPPSPVSPHTTFCAVSPVTSTPLTSFGEPFPYARPASRLGVLKHSKKLHVTLPAGRAGPVTM